MTPTVDQLWDIEQIKQLKARYFRFLDTKDWNSFARLFTDDCVHHLPQEAQKPAVGNEEYFRDLKVQLGNGVTTHPRPYAGDHAPQRYRGGRHLGHVRLRPGRSPFRSGQHQGLRPLLRDV